MRSRKAVKKPPQRARDSFKFTSKIITISDKRNEEKLHQITVTDFRASPPRGSRCLGLASSSLGDCVFLSISREKKIVLTCPLLFLLSNQPCKPHPHFHDHLYTDRHTHTHQKGSLGFKNGDESGPSVVPISLSSARVPTQQIWHPGKYFPFFLKKGS